MPKRLNLFERKVKAALDISDNSEQEELTDRRARGLGIRPNNKRTKRDYSNIPSDRNPKLIINLNPSMPKQTIQIHTKISQKSYLEEAKRKLEERRAYYSNLNNKIKSSVTNVVKATQDLARTAEIRQRVLARNQAAASQMYKNDDIDSVYMPWMMENYGRKLAIEALKRRGNMVDSTDHQQTTISAPRFSNYFVANKQKPSVKQKRYKSPYISQYYAPIADTQTVKRDDLWVIDKDIRRYVRRSRRIDDENMDDEISITDSETSSEDTRPIVPSKIEKPDVSLKNKILKTINKSLLTTELTGIDMKTLQLNDQVNSFTLK